MSHDSDETYDVYYRATVTARKPHVCCACREVIGRGDTYVRVSVIYDHTASSYKRCPRCEHIFNRIVENLPDKYEWPDEDLNCGHEWVENLGIPLPDDLAELAFMPRADVQAIAGRLLGRLKKDKTDADID